MTVALASCSALPRPDADLPHLSASLARRGVASEVVASDDPRVEWRRFDAVVVRSTWDYVERLDEFVPWIDLVGSATRLLNPAPVLRWNLHKRYLLELAALGIDVVRTALVPAGRSADWPALFAEFGDLVLKPAVSAGSFATIRIEAGDAARAETHRKTHENRDLLVQPLLGSVLARGETNIVAIDGRPMHAVLKGARWCGDAEQSRGLVVAADAELALAARVLETLHGIGFATPLYARIDCAEGPDGRPLLMELELLEPSLFLDRAPLSADAMADGVVRTLGGG